MTPPFTVSFCSLNVRGISQTLKRRQVLRWLHNNNFDVTILQETYSTENIENIWKSEWGGKIYFCHGSSHSKGVMIFSNPKLAPQIDRYLLLQAIISDTTFQLCNNYSANNNSDQKLFFSSILNVLRKRSEINSIIGGDFNRALTQCDKLDGAAVEIEKQCN